MEKQLLSALINFFFLRLFFDWVARVQQLIVSRSKSFFHTKVLRLNAHESTLSCEFNACSSAEKPMYLAPSRRNLSCSQNESEKKLDEHDEIELVMERLGLFCSKDDERVSYNEISTLFDENAPCLDEVKAAFCVFDQNNDGFIDENDLRIVMGALDIQEGMTVAGCRNMIRDYDVNGDGFIDFNEFVKVMEKSFC